MADKKKAPKKKTIKPTVTIPAGEAEPSPEKTAADAQAALDHILSEMGAAVLQFTVAHTGTDVKVKLDLVTGDLCVGRGPDWRTALNRASVKAKVFYGAFRKRAPQT